VFDGECYSAGYLKDGQIPFFKIYDLSSDSYYYAFIEGDIIDAWTGLPDDDSGAFQLNGYLIADTLAVTYDCNDVLGGTALYDTCNICSGGDTSHLADSDIDCFGECFGTAFIDGCNDCVGGNTGIEECQNDCLGDLGGIAFNDDCGTCSGGSSCDGENSDQDCQGVCFGDAYIDGCGTCVGGTTGEESCPIDCMGILTPEDCSESLTPGCATFDDCATCVNGNSGNTFNQEADCLGE
jgi:hypothetical protein